MSQPTGFHDARGIPIHVGDLIRVKHFRHYLRREQMWLYFRVAVVRNRIVIQNWDNLDPERHQTLLESVARRHGDPCIEVLEHSGPETNERGELITFNERPRLKRKAGEP
jgi:hypothetical protein